VAAAAPCKAHDDLMGNEALTSNRHCHEIAGPAEDKEPMPAFDLFSIGHFNIPAERFVAGQGDRLAAAYRGRARASAFRPSAFRQKSVTKRAATAEKW
jgi:hypothetical protein